MSEAMPLPTLHGERIALRRLTRDDVDALFAVFGDPEVMRFWSTPPHVDRSEAASLVERIDAAVAARTLFQWGIVPHEVGAVIGTCTLVGIDWSNRRAEIGFALARAHWRRGYATDALRRVLRYAFDELGLTRLEADVDPRNGASLRTLERLGFRREGLLRERWFVAGEVQDSVILGLLAREWRAPH